MAVTITFGKFEVLQGYLDIKDNILSLQWNLRKSEHELDRWLTGDLSRIAVAEGSKQAKLEEHITEIKTELAVQKQEAQEAEALLKAFDGIDSAIVYGKYVEGKTLEQIANDCDYSYSYVKQRHAELKRRLTFIDKYELDVLRFSLDR